MRNTRNQFLGLSCKSNNTYTNPEEKKFLMKILILIEIFKFKFIKW